MTPQYIVDDSRRLQEIFIENQLKRPDLIITSPPYFDVLNYDNHYSQIGFKQKYNDYISDVVGVLQSCYDLANENATLWLVVDTFRRNGELKLLPFDLINEIKENTDHSWKLKEIVIWDKEKSMPWNGKGSFKNEFEYIIFFAKGENFTFNFDEVREINDLKKWWKTYPERYNPNGKAPSNIWSFITPMRGWGNNVQKHLCPFPFPLVEKIISIASNEGDVVFDPFAGSGTVLAIASVMSRFSFGIDINAQYKKTFEEQVLLGAKKHWTDRQKVKEKHSVGLENYAILNNKLRKMKVASAVCQHVNKSNNHQFLYVTKDNLTENNIVEIYVMENGVTPKIDLEDKALKFLIQQAKVKPILHIEKEIPFYEKFMDIRLYKYRYNRFYAYTSPCKFPNIGKREEMYNFIYSDIELKVLE
ncbi:hypothetical protein AWR27_17760 [Spirosoma montaniterrae]|uniref:Methyltransferase n=1 Tax=Spirosoma montaniterrae TaxID=1178516 RepID=A0A1P9X056_9BACT|nr:hypothetical protein AWR27_17760 [Spirosoma montaniterrae]